MLPPFVKGCNSCAAGMVLSAAHTVCALHAVSSAVQALWANLSSMLQQLLADTLLETEVAISMSLSMAGALADQANFTTNSSSKTEEKDSSTAAAGAADSNTAGTSTAAAGVSVSSACQLLELAAQLTQYCRQQALQLAQQQAPVDSPAAAAAPAEQSPVVQHIVGVQQQVLLRLGQAYLATQQHAKALECVSTLQDLSGGCIASPDAVVQLSIRALIGQNKLVAAAAELVAWLKQGSQLAAAAAAAGQDQHTQEQQQKSTAEACAVVDASLQALHVHAGRADSMHAAAAAAGGVLAGGSSAVAAAGVDVQQLVQQVAGAAAERCQGQPGVAVAVALRLLEHQASLALSS